MLDFLFIIEILLLKHRFAVFIDIGDINFLKLNAYNLNCYVTYIDESLV